MRDPFEDFNRIFRDMQNMIDNQFSGARQYQPKQKSKPKQPVSQNQNQLIIDKKNKKIYFTIEFPTVKSKEDILITVEKERMFIEITINDRKWKNQINFPIPVKPKTTKSKFVHLTRILDIEIDMDETIHETAGDTSGIKETSS